jgi:replicative DNA helicase
MRLRATGRALPETPRRESSIVDGRGNDEQGRTMGATEHALGQSTRQTYSARLTQVLSDIDTQLTTRSAADVRTVQTGWDVLDEMLGGGLHAGELALLGGPPGVGKTIAALQWARNIARAGHRSLYVCYEHEPAALLVRLLALEAAEAGGDRTVGRTLLDALGRADRAGLSLEDTLRHTPAGLEALERLRAYADRLTLVRALGAHTTVDELRELVDANTDPGQRTAVFVDYLQKIPLHPEPEHESEKVTRTVEALKDLALDYHVPLVVLSAVDRAGLEVSRLRMHHLRGSSAVSFESDVVLMLNDKHKAVSKVHLSYDERAARSFREWVVFSVEKNRGGPNLIDLEFRKDFSHFRFHEDGGLVSERLVDERMEEYEL